MAILLALFSVFLLFGYASTQEQIKVMRIDDSYVYTPSNPTGIQYSTGWIHFSGNDVPGRYLDTLSTTITPNASAVFFFKGWFLYLSDKGYDSNALIYKAIPSRIIRMHSQIIL